MAIDFSQVKALSIPEGNVISISSGGVVIWSAGPRLTSITLSGYNSSLNINSTFIYGGTVTAHYSDNTTADVTLSTTFTGYDMSTAGQQTVTASYTEGGVTVTATYTLNVVSVGWHTIWEGNAGVTWNTSKSTTPPSSVTVYDCPGDIVSPSGARLRFTFSMSNKGGAGHYVSPTSTDWTLTTKPTSPVTVESIDVTIPTSTTNTRTSIVGVESTQPGDATRSQMRLRLALYRRKSSTLNISRIEVYPERGEYSSGSTATISLYVTKIEQYY